MKFLNLAINSIKKLIPRNIQDKLFVYYVSLDSLTTLYTVALDTPVISAILFPVYCFVSYNDLIIPFLSSLTPGLPPLLPRALADSKPFFVR